MARKQKLVLGVDIGSHAIKICQLQATPQGYKVIAVGSNAIPLEAVEDGVLQEPEEVSKALEALIKNLKIKNKKIGISISGHSVIVKKINLEFMEEESLESYIYEEAEQYIPFDLDDVCLDFQKLPNRDDIEGHEIMLVAAKKEVINDYMALLEGLKLQPTLVDVDGFAMENIWEICSKNQENVALVDIGATKMNINIIAQGSSVLARDIVVGSEQLTDQLANLLDLSYDQAEKVKLGLMEAPEEHAQAIQEIFNETCAQWAGEIKRAIDYYLSNNPDNPLEKLVLSGGGSKVQGLSDYLAEKTHLDVLSFNPFAEMAINPKHIDRQYLNQVAPEMAIAAGLAIRTAAF